MNEDVQPINDDGNELASLCFDFIEFSGWGWFFFPNLSPGNFLCGIICGVLNNSEISIR